ncbi:MAG: T9SS type A sorting domain-containing protein [Bacteroidetes bacterium]|nr:T9SS type A sorting domain-containing protein [Bacteroidota bacterium]
MNRMALLLAATILVIVAAADTAHAQQPPECSDSAAWIGMGEGLSNPGSWASDQAGASFTATLNGELLACHAGHHNYGNPDSVVEISAWNGSYWRQFAGFTVASSGGYVAGIAAYRNQLYVFGNLANFNRSGSRPTLVRWNGTAWDTVHVPGDDSMAIISMTIHGDRACFRRGSVRNYRKDFPAWDGSAWDSIPSGALTNLEGITGDGDRLYAFGQLHSTKFNDVVVRWNGSDWEQLGDPFPDGIREIVAAHGELYAIVRIPQAYDGLWKWNGSAWQAIPLPSGDNQYWLTALPHNGQVYVACAAVSGASLYNYMARYDGTQWHMLPRFNAVAPLTWFAEYGNNIVVLGSMTRSCNQLLHYAAILCDDGTCGTVAGNVYADHYPYCAPQAGDAPLPGRIVAVKPGPYYAITDTAGNYRTMVPVGAYNIMLAPYLYWNQTCPANGAPRSASVVRPAEVADGREFGTVPIPGMRDLRIDVASGTIRPGRESTVAISVDNVGTVPVDSAYVHFVMDRHLDLLGAVPAPVGSSPGLAQWKLGPMAVGARVVIKVRVLADTTLLAGTDICHELMVENPKDQTPADNVARFCTRALSSHDPNEIGVLPSGNGAHGTIGPADTVLKYTVRFQNNGTDTAFDVAVYDTLPPGLDPTTLQLGASSHPYTLSFGRGGALIWRFIEINLPDSTLDEAASQGYFNYSIRLARGIQPGTSIPNHASIYFDYNAPVPTNTVVVTTPDASEVPWASADAVTLAPNPAKETITINGALAPGSTIIVRNMLGAEVMRRSAGSGMARQIDVSALPSGNYLVAVTGTHSAVTLPLQIVR